MLHIIKLNYNKCLIPKKRKIYISFSNYNIYEVGDFMYYKSNNRPFEVRMHVYIIHFDCIVSIYQYYRLLLLLLTVNCNDIIVIE
jgi:hypothetical protein